MDQWYMLSLVGKDQPGLVAKLSAALCRHGCNLGDSSMARMGGNFTIMVMVQWDGEKSALETIVDPLASELGLTFHVDAVAGNMEHHVQPDIRISLYAEDRKGIVEEVTTLLAEAGLNILQLDSNVDEDPSKGKTYYLHIEGTLSKGIEPVEDALEILCEQKKMTIQLIPIHPSTK